MICHLLTTDRIEKFQKWAKKGLEISLEIENKDLIKQFRKFNNAARKKIRYIYQNKFVFLSSNPLNSINPKPHGGLYIQKDLKEYLIEDLKSFNKNILVHFDILNKKIMYELFTENKGCKLLVLDTCSLRKKSIPAEGPDLTEDSLMLDELKSMKEKDPRVKVNIDILVLLGEKGEYLAKFASECNIPVVIYFDFKNKSSHFTDILTTFLNTEFKYNFLKHFVTYMVKGQTSTDAIINSKQDTVEYLQYIMNTEYELVDAWIRSFDHILKEQDGKKLEEFKKLEKSAKKNEGKKR